MSRIFIFIFIFPLIHHEVEAQAFTYDNSNSKYSVSLPDGAAGWLIPTSPVPPLKAGSKAQATAMFVEFGDGTFSFLSDGPHQFYTAFPNRNVTAKATGVYGGGGPPPKFQSYMVGDGCLLSTNSLNTSYSYSTYVPMGILEGDERIEITPNIGSVVAKDTMIFVLTYKLKLKESAKTLLFLYNDQDAFEVVNKADQMEPDLTTTLTSPFVRAYSGEAETDVDASATVATVRKVNSQYNNALAFNLLKADTLEHNIFITLIPREGLVGKDLSETFVKAYLIGENNGETDTAAALAPLPILNLSHDPNYITVKPACLTFPKAGKQLEYHVHFQNTGPGSASLVRVAVKIPGNVDMNTDISFSPPPHHPLQFYKVLKGKLSSNCLWPYGNPSLDSLIFVFEKDMGDCTLDGMNPAPTCMCKDSTMGDFWFTINATNQMPDILLAQASIVFVNSADGMPNDPIITNTAISQFRECCECKKSCDPCKNKKGLWKWLFCDKCGTKKTTVKKTNRNLSKKK
ncbi:MAG: hypothetical protein IPL84_15980 [Chitinophagaceae bacterium]|nr:hypothetical protein [Chitinophagaceae bacterium]